MHTEVKVTHGWKEKRYVDRLKDLACRLGFDYFEKQKYVSGHHEPDLVWKKANIEIGFEVECRASNKKAVGDAYYLNRSFQIGFILVKEKLKSLRKLITDLGDFKRVHVVNADELEEEIKKILENGARCKICLRRLYFTATLCFFGAGAGVFLGMLTSSKPSLRVDSAFSGITSSGNDNLL